MSIQDSNYRGSSIYMGNKSYGIKARLEFGVKCDLIKRKYARNFRGKNKKGQRDKEYKLFEINESFIIIIINKLQMIKLSRINLS